MANHANISFFIPHLGCSHRCSFCDQSSITGQDALPNADDIITAVEGAKAHRGYNAQNTEIAFFGGSFTAIDREYMIELLTAAYPFVKSGAVKGIRVSTRPDAITAEILKILKAYGVTAIELGAQSMDQSVLDCNRRGHTADDVKNACRLIKEYGFDLGLQMMTGLYNSTKETDLFTVNEFIALAPKTVRIYPTVVLKRTMLAVLVKNKEYIPPTLEEAVESCSLYYKMFTESGINVIRMGLHHINEADYVAGPWHPAFSELCLSRIHRNKVIESLNEKPVGKYIIFVAEKDISVAVGQKKENIVLYKKMGYECRVKGNASLNNGEFIIEQDV